MPDDPEKEAIMIRTTLRDIKSQVGNYCKDVTRWSNEDLYKLQKDHQLRKIAYSAGTYGITGALFLDEEGNMYAVTSRSNAIFILD